MNYSLKKVNMKSKLLSIIIPISIDKNYYLFDRLKILLEFFIQYDEYIECIIVDSSTNQYKQKIEELCKSNSHKYSFVEQKDTYSSAIARNEGSKKATTEYLLFFDVYLIITSMFIDKIKEHINVIKNSSIHNFFIYPCLYLSEEFTKKLSTEYNKLKENDFCKIKERYMLGYNDQVLYLAVNTSTILVNKTHFFNIGAYNQNFKGHGYEDFELIHRLFINYNKVEIQSDYLEDFKSNFPYKYKGFRKYYAFYSLPNFFENMYTLHLWHPRPLQKTYYRVREDNSIYFKERLIISLKFDKINKINNENSNSYTDLIDKLMNKYNYDKKKYIGLEEINDWSIKNKPSSFKRKLKKLIYNPKQFFKDM